MNELLARKNSLGLPLAFLLIVLSTLLPRPSLGAVMPAYERLQPVTAYIAAAVDVAADQAGRLYVADSTYNSVVVFDKNGKYAATLPGLSHPLCVAVNADGNIYIGNKDSADVEVYNSNFTFLHKLGLKNGDHEFTQPNDLAIAATGQIYVADRDADSIKVYNPDGTFATSFGESGNEDGEFHRPVSIAINENAAELIVLDHQLSLDVNTSNWIDGARIQVFDMNGVFKRGFTKFERSAEDMFKAQQLTVDRQGALYITDSYHNVIFVYDSSDGAYLGAIHDGQNQLRTPMGITLGQNNLLYVASRGTGTVEAYLLDQNIPAGEIIDSSDEELPLTAKPELSITPPSALTFTSTEGSIPADLQLSITNIGSGTLTWSAVTAQSWIRLSNTSGTAPGSVTVSVDPTSLAVGEYMATVIITADGAASSPFHIGVTLTITNTNTNTNTILQEHVTDDQDNLNNQDSQDDQDNLYNHDNQSEFPWILFKHLLCPKR